MTTARAAGAAKGSASRGASRAGGGKRGKPIRTGRPGPVTSTESKEQKAKTEAPPPSHDKNVRPAGMRSRVGVRATTNGSPFADLRLGGTILSPAAHKNPEKAREERRKLWARLGANSTSQTGFAHLLENVEGEVSEDGDDKTQRGSGRGPSGTRQRGAGRATLRVGFTAHREKFAKALRLEVRFGAFPNHNTVYCPSVTTLVIKRKNTTYSTSRLFAHTVHPYSRLKTDTFLLQLQLASLQGIAKEDGVEVLGITCDTPFVMGPWSETAGIKCLSDVSNKTQEAYVGTIDFGKFLDDLDVSTNMAGYMSCKRGCVVLDADQKVLYTWTGMPDQLPDASEIQAALGIGKVNL